MQYFVVDVFTDNLFAGNPAGVCVAERPLEAETMQRIAAENNLPETAFVIRRGEDYDLRWFSPETEIDLCGHATMGTASVLLSVFEQGRENIVFHTMSGELRVRREGQMYRMNFPSRPAAKINAVPGLGRALGCEPLEVLQSRDLLAVLEDEEQVRSLQPDMDLLKEIKDTFAIIVTAKGKDADFVSRFFAPGAGIPEDPVTGSSHCTLIPYWSGRLGKTELLARQLSKRGGTLFCRDLGGRVEIGGRCVLYLKGEIFI